MKRLAAVLGLAGLVWCTSVEADVVIDRAGNVFFGTLVPAPQGVALETGGRTLTWESSAVRQGDNLALLADQTLAVHLRDGSVIRGVYRDYDDGVGLFLRIAFGVLTIPLAHIEHVELAAATEKANSAVGSLPGVSTGALAWFPLNASNLGLGGGGLLATTQPLPWGNGWALAQEVEYVLLANTTSPQLDYRWFGASLGVRSEVLRWWTQTPPGEWSPFVGLHSGLFMVAVEDRRTNAQNTHYGSINLRIALELGLAWTTPWAGWALEAGLAGAFVGQETAPLWLAGFRIDGVYHLSNR